MDVLKAGKDAYVRICVSAHTRTHRRAYASRADLLMPSLKLGVSLLNIT